MNSTSNRGFPAGNPIANALVIVVGLLTIAASVVLGFFAFLVVATLVAICAAVLGMRAWWLRHRRDGTPTTGTRSDREARAGRRTSGNVIEGEFQVIEGNKKRDDRH